MNKDRETIDLLTGASLLASRNLSAPAGHFARSALQRMLADEFPDRSLQEALESLAAGDGHPAAEAGRIAGMLAELSPYLQPANTYLPGFIQVKIRELVDRICSLFNARGGPKIEADLEKLGDEDWERLEAVLGEIARRLRSSDALPFEETDFENLVVLREKVQIWAPALGDGFRRRGIEYKLDSISRVNNTSGYIWVAFLKDFALKKVEQGSYSLTFTPTHLRAGLEMGGRSRPWRENYYQALTDGEIDDILEDFARLDCSFLDTFWYFNISGSLPVREYLQKSKYSREIVRKKIEKALTRLPEENLYCWNILLPARPIPPEELVRDKAASAGLIEEIGEVTGRLLERIRP